MVVSLICTESLREQLAVISVSLTLGIVTTVSDVAVYAKKRRKRGTTGAIPELPTIGPIGPPLPAGCNYGKLNQPYLVG